MTIEAIDLTKYSCLDGTSTRKLRILTFSTLYPNEEQPHHGIFVENRLRHLVGTGQVESVVVAPVPYFPRSAPGFAKWKTYTRIPHLENRDSIAVYHPRYPVIPKIGESISPALLAISSLSTLQRIRQSGYDFDLIDSHYMYPDGVAATWLGHHLNKPVVVTARGTDVNLIPRHRLPRHLIQRSLTKLAGVIAVSQALKDALVAIGGHPEDITVLRNGVDLGAFIPLDRIAARRELSLDGPTLLSVGHLIERKGHDLIIRALSQLPEYRLLIVGDGPERDALIQLSRQLDVAARVRFLGAQPHCALPLFYNAADALVLASSREGWANVLLEAMACGTPVVASNVWGNPEVVGSSVAGRLMTERSAAGVAGAVRALFAAPPDRAATRRYAEKFSWDETSNGQIALFNRVLNR
jgi:teichuronic acid biosynthesis glycosyltransferase TuaC